MSFIESCGAKRRRRLRVTHEIRVLALPPSCLLVVLMGSPRPLSEGLESASKDETYT
jgi:hypothetical protein